MLSALLVTYLATNPLPNLEGPIYSQPSTMGRFAYFELAPPGGAGMTAPCASSNPSGAKGEAMSFTRTGVATCSTTSNGIFATSGIANGALVEVPTDVIRVETDSTGAREVLMEQSKQNALPRFIDYGNAAWADVGTPTLTGGQTSPWTGTYATSAVQFDDNDAAGFEGRSQAITVSAGAAYFMHCLVKGGSLAEARITLDGTAATITGLSSSTWSIISVADVSSSGVAITAQVMNGDATGDTGTVIWGGCQVESGTYRTSMIPTAGTAVTRNADGTPVFSGVSLAALAASGCAAANMTPLGTSGMVGGLLIANSAGRFLYTVGSTLRSYDGTTEPTLAANFIIATRRRYRSTWSGATQTLYNVTDATSNSGAFDGAMNVTGPLHVGASAVIGFASDARLGAFQLDPNPSRCL